MTPLEWLEKLHEALDKRAASVAEARAWYDGDHPIPEPPPNTPATSDAEARKAFNAMAKLAVTNFLPPVVDAPAQKLRIEGFRFSRDSTAADRDLWDIYRRNHLLTDGPLTIHEAIQTGQSFFMVWPGADGLAEITVEDPACTIVAYAAGSRRVRAAAFKRWLGEDGHLYANLYLPGEIYKYRSKQRDGSALIVPGTSEYRTHWEIREVPGEMWPVAHPYGVPIVEGRVNAPLRAAPFGGGRPQFAKQITTQRRINRTVMGRLVTEDSQSFRQRWATGWDYPTLEDGTTPDKAALQKASAARLWAFDDPDVSVGEFSQADFQPFLKAVQEDVKVLAAQSATPPYAFLLGDMINVASDSLARIEGSHLATVRALADQLSEAFVEVMRLALSVEGDPRAADPSLSVVWGEFEQRTATEQANLAQIMAGLGAPAEKVYAALPGVDAAEAARWAEQATSDLLLASALTSDAPQAPAAP